MKYDSRMPLKLLGTEVDDVLRFILSEGSENLFLSSEGGKENLKQFGTEVDNVVLEADGFRDERLFVYQHVLLFLLS